MGIPCCLTATMGRRFRREAEDTPKTMSFMHLHLGVEGPLPAGIDVRRADTDTAPPTHPSPYPSQEHGSYAQVSPACRHSHLYRCPLPLVPPRRAAAALLGLASVGNDAVKTRLSLRELDDHGTIFLGCSSPFIRLAEHLTALRS